MYKKYDVRQETVIPQWAEDMVMNDKHKYMELHNRDWLQWNLDFNYNGFAKDKQSFYAVYDKMGIPKGFFMTKERFENKVGNCSNIIRGTIVEWASIDNELSEFDLNLMALPTFSPETCIVHTITTDSKTTKLFKKSGFVRHGLFQMNVFDKKKRYGDIANIDLWRVRYGCSNSIIFGEGKIIYK